MDRIIVCSNCGQKLRIPSDKEGRATCPKCKYTFLIGAASSGSGMFADYIKKDQEAKANAVDPVKLEQEREAAKEQLKQNLIPYIRQALSELPGVLTQLDYKGFTFEEEYTTGTLFKQKHWNHQKAWRLCCIRNHYDYYQYYASKICITETGKFVTSLSRVSSLDWAPYKGTCVSADTAANIIADEMIGSIEALRIYKRVLEGKIKDGPIQSRDDYRKSLQNITVIGKIDMQNYNGAVKDYFVHILDTLSGKHSVHYPGELED